MDVGLPDGRLAEAREWLEALMRAVSLMTAAWLVLAGFRRFRPGAVIVFLLIQNPALRCSLWVGCEVVWFVVWASSSVG